MSEPFTQAWLALREPFDHAARSESLADGLAAVLPPDPQLLEIACGTGSGVRWLAERLGPCHWVLVDHDPDLLHTAGQGMASPSAGGPRMLQHDLRDLAGLRVPADAVTCQALLDLVSHQWLAAFAAWMNARRVPLLAALTVDGRVQWSPEHRDDASVEQAFAAHQLLDRGFGPSPGTGAAAELARSLRARGWSVQLRRSDWRIAPDNREMLQHMVQGHATAARVCHPDPQQVDRWEQVRLADAARGRVALQVGHVDLLALPPPLASS